jgi:preprotein translocase subunit SecE
MAKNKDAAEKAAPKKQNAPKKGGRQAGAPAKPSLFQRIATYFRGVVSEMKRVVWPSRQEVVNSTFIVLVTLVFFAIFTFVIDWLATGGMELIIGFAQSS